MLWAKVKEKWRPPQSLSKGKSDLETIIYVVIEKDGNVQKAWVEKKSGNDLYDKEAMKALKKAEPFPPPPIESANDKLKIGFRFYPD